MTDQHKFYKAAVNAYNWSSFYPEKRALSECAWYDSVCAEFRALGKEGATEKLDSLFSKYLAALSRCASSAITGPARFPVARMEKNRRYADNHAKELYEFIDRVKKPPTPPRHEIDYQIAAKEYTIGEVRVLQNVDDNRIQLFYPDKPDAETIAKLKSRGFKWSPRNKAWQRQLTPMALSAVRQLLTVTP